MCRGRKLTAAQQHWVLQGDGKKGRKHWYGVKGYFEYLERKAYKMHVRVLLSRYRSYTECPACKGARLKPESLLWRLSAPYNFHDLALLPVHRCREFFDAAAPAAAVDARPTTCCCGEIRARLGYLCEVGLGYLTLDRQSRTLSGGEVQRINLTTALGTSLVNTLFVLDEPSIGLHPRDMGARDRRDAAAARCRQHAAGGGARSADHGRGRPPHRHGPGRRRARRRASCSTAPAREIVHCAKGRSPAITLPAGAASMRAAAQAEPAPARPAQADADGASLHNVRGRHARVPLGKLVCVTGVSGSGKSTLVTELLYPALQRAFGKAAESDRQVHAARPAAQR